MLGITPQAVQEFKKILAEKGKAGQAIRIFSIGGGCCGPSVGMDMVDQGQAGDELLQQEGFLLYVEDKASVALNGVTIDFTRDGSQKGFILKQPAGGGCCS
jgi:iron-sulfur cluster assembly protein